ncbi:MAG: SDR family oxidoreductase, partial [Maribacter sp.]|nr:SDR family oxidoreductase [Maribacter sp.]
MNRKWALILGGSSGLGLATAKKLAKHGFHIIVIHRDRRADLEAINSEFDEITSNGGLLKAFNVDALQKTKRNTVINDIIDTLPTGHKINVMVHSIAKGNLKPMYAEGEDTLTDQDF